GATGPAWRSRSACGPNGQPAFERCWRLASSAGKWARAGSSLNRSPLQRSEVTYMADPGEIDLTVRNWNDIAADFVGAEPTGTLLIGNGLSRAIWDDFSYESLLDRA